MRTVPTKNCAENVSLLIIMSIRMEVGEVRPSPIVAISDDVRRVDHNHNISDITVPSRAVRIRYFQSRCSGQENVSIPA